MKKYYLLFVTGLILVSCTDQLIIDETSGEVSAQTPESNIRTLIEQARWGDAHAYRELADCYRNGVGVEPDLISMLGMAALSEEYGDADSFEDYLNGLPDDSNEKLIINAVDGYEHKKMIVDSLVEMLEAKACKDVWAVKGILAIERGDTVEGMRCFEVGVENGSALADLMLCVPNMNASSRPDPQKLEALSDKIPFVNKMLGDFYSGLYRDEDINEELAAHYYLMADKYAYLDRRHARWLLDYYYNGGRLNICERDIERLETLAGKKQVEPVAEKFNDYELEASIKNMMKEDLADWPKWDRGMVYVVEKATGRMIANVSLQSKGGHLVPYKDTYDEEQSTMVGAAAYLAILSSDKVMPNQIFDTGNGIYGNVRDNNWRRGGYHEIDLEKALCLRSLVGLTMAKEYVFGEDSVAYDDKIYGYLAGEPDNALGILTFYNAVANDGRMLRIISEGEDGIVINEQIARPEHIRALQTGLKHVVSEGHCKWASNSRTSVSACARTFVTQGNRRRMELCGYFPSEHPYYTIMVILERDGLPASAGKMCGEVFSKTIDIMVDMYGLQLYLRE